MAANILLLAFLVAPLILFLEAFSFIRNARSSGQLSRVSLIRGNLLVLMLLLSGVVLGGEVYFRFIYDSTDSFGLCKTTKEWFERHFHRNRTGFRDSVNYLPNVASGKRRISFVGDSFTIGHGIPDVDDRFANRVRKLRPQYEVHVLAECGWDTEKMLDVVKYVPSSGYEVDTVVLVYCLNDISDIAPEWQEILNRIYQAPEPGFLAKHSYLFNTLHARLRIAEEPEIRDYYGFIRSAYDGPVWPQQQKRLQELHESVVSSGGNLMVVTFPFLHALENDYAYKDIHDKLNQFWIDRNVPHLDLLDIYKTGPPKDLTVNARDVHPNQKAHAMAADAIADFIDVSIKDRVSGQTLSGPPLRD